MKTTLSILIATLILANAASAAPGSNDYAAATKPAYDDGSWYPGKYPGDPTDKKHKDYKSDGHADGYSSGDDHHSDDDGHYSDHDDHHSDHDDHHANDYYGGGQNYHRASPYDYAPKGRARSYSRSRERVNQWHDMNGSGYGHTYTRNWHGQGQYYLQRRSMPAEEGVRGRTLVRRSDAQKPALEKRGDYDYDNDSHHSDHDGYSTGHDSDHHSDHDDDHHWRPHYWRPRPRPRPYGYGNGYGYGHNNGYYRLMKRDLATEEQPALEKRSGGYGSDGYGSDHNGHHGGYSGYDSDHHHNGPRRWRPRRRYPRRNWWPYWNGGYWNGNYYNNGYY